MIVFVIMLMVAITILFIVMIKIMKTLEPINGIIIMISMMIVT